MKLYKNNYCDRIFLKMFCSLAFVPPAKVHHEYEKIKKHIPSTIPMCINSFFEYFEQEYMYSNECILRWNAVYRLKHDIPLITNTVESQQQFCKVYQCFTP
jgi:hypothetical protein